MKTASNPYRDLSRDDLNAAANHRAGELMNPTGSRSREDRVTLALDTAHLLLALALQVSDGKYSPGTPQRDIYANGIGLREAFSKAYARKLQQLRYDIFMQAADVTLGGGVPYWMAHDVVGRELYEAATQSEAGLLYALEKMQAMHETRRK